MVRRMRSLVLLISIFCLIFLMSNIRGGNLISVAWNIPRVIPVPGNKGGIIRGSNIYVRVKNEGEACRVSLSYVLRPNTDNITVSFSQKNFELEEGQTRTIYIEIVVMSGTIAGSYNLTLRLYAEAKSNGNTISRAFEYQATIVVGGESYTLVVSLVQPDGSPIWGTVRLAYIYQGTLNYIFEDRGYRVIFYVIAGDYRIEASTGGYSVSQDIHVDQDMNITLTMAAIRLEDFSVDLVPRDTMDPIIFHVYLVNDDPMAWGKRISICLLYTSPSPRDRG